MVVYFLLRRRFRLGEAVFLEQDPSVKKLGKKEAAIFFSQFAFDFLSLMFVGLVVGARLGYVLFYNPGYYLSHPLAIISPFAEGTGQFVGIYGLSYHGGLVGIVLAALFFARKRGLNFWLLADFVVPAVPLGYFFGRLGNFFNGELYGRETERLWGMFFPADELGLLRHPSQLYEAFFEGLVLFLLVWKVRNHAFFRGNLFWLYLLGYGAFRILCEFFREPDEQLGYVFASLTMGQIMSFLMLFSPLVFFAWKKIKNLL